MEREKKLLVRKEMLVLYQIEAKHIIVEQKRDLKKLKINRQQLYNEVIQPGKAYTIKCLLVTL